MKLPAFEYACPSTLREAVALLASGEGDAKVIAGGQSLVPMLNFRVASPALVVDLRGCRAAGIYVADAGVRLGAMVRWRASGRRTSPRRIRSSEPRSARSRTSDPQSRHHRRQHRACRSGGGVAGHCGDLRRRDRSGRARRRARIIRAADMFIAPLTTALAVDEIIVEIQLHRLG